MSAPFNYERHKAFGWLVHKKLLLANEKYRVVVPAAVAADKVDNITLWTKGRIEGIDIASSMQIPPRVAGFNSFIRGDVPAGEYLFTAVEDSEWWCINYTANRNRLPIVQVFLASKGEIKELPIGTRLLICRGAAAVNGQSHTAPAAFDVKQSPATLQANEDCFGFIFAAEA